MPLLQLWSAGCLFVLCAGSQPVAIPPICASCHRPIHHAGGGLPIIHVPVYSLQLLPGYTPDLQLLATLETLLHNPRLNSAAHEPWALLGAMARAYQQQPSRAPPPGSPTWLVLASMAVALRKHAARHEVQARSNILQQLSLLSGRLNALPPLLQLAAVALQQPAAGWGALVLGSAVQGATLACCASAVKVVARQVLSLANSAPLQLSEHPQLRLLQLLRTSVSRSGIAVAAADIRGMCVKLAQVYRVHSLRTQAATTSSTGAAAGTRAAAVSSVTQAGGNVPDPPADHSATVDVFMTLMYARDLLPALGSNGPQGQQTAAGTGSSPPRWLDAAMMDCCRAPNMLDHITALANVCTAAAICANSCSSTIQLLGCAHLGCVTPLPGGLGACEASLVVNTRSSVCGGCGVARYCSRACALQDWPHHRRTCHRLQVARRRGCRPEGVWQEMEAYCDRAQSCTSLQTLESKHHAFVYIRKRASTSTPPQFTLHPDSSSSHGCLQSCLA
jgi:hypothetical protein